MSWRVTTLYRTKRSRPCCNQALTTLLQRIAGLRIRRVIEGVRGNIDLTYYHQTVEQYRAINYYPDDPNGG